MEEDKISRIFREYDPELSSSITFVERLERNLNAVEMIHRENAVVMKRNKTAVGIAACTGFISGVIFTLLLPYITNMIRSLVESIIGLTGQQAIPDYSQAFSWIIIGTISVFVAVNTYDIALSLQPLKDVKLGDRHP
ncbi:MAG: hypothetical protein K2J58_01740 [Muribaculaceae bacterium]|nr:hypothetical protein [Muribaculaceae bacterium]